MMNDLTFEILQKIRSHLWDAEHEMSVNRDDLAFMDPFDRISLQRLLRQVAMEITDHIHTENGWSDVFVGTPQRKQRAER